MRWDLFCRVIDNHGDLGVCWRLARELHGAGEQVRLWVDDASALDWLAPGGPQGQLGVQVRPWAEAAAAADGGGAESGEAVGDVVVEAFGCDPPPSFVARMAAREPRPVWINLEYLSAEAYVERSHGLPSPQVAGPGAGLMKWFYFPGFTPATGGLPGAANAAAGALQATPQAAASVDAWLARWADPTPAAAADPAMADARPLVFLFCYANPALPAWLRAWSTQGVRLAVAAGWPAREVGRWLVHTGVRSSEAAAGETVAFGRSTALFLPHVSQEAFDAWIARADFSLVRGEDSWIRALWSGKPFVWQPYVQDDGAHRLKLEAFLQQYLQGADPAVADAIRAAHGSWQAPDPSTAAATWLPDRGPDVAWCRFAGRRCRSLATQVPDLAQALRGFALGKR